MSASPVSDITTAASHPTEQTSEQTAAQVTSKGCSKVFILCALYRTLRGCRRELAAGGDICFPFDVSRVATWLQEAAEDCTRPQAVVLQAQLGGVDFDSADRHTYWTEPKQLNTWWKNNLERKAQFARLVKEAAYTGEDANLATR